MKYVVKYKDSVVEKIKSLDYSEFKMFDIDEHYIVTSSFIENMESEVMFRCLDGSFVESVKKKECLVFIDVRE